MQRKLFAVLVLTALIPAVLFASGGKIRGKVADAGTGEPLVGANVVIVGTSMGAATDVTGEFLILNVPVGTYTLKGSYIGYQTITMSNIRVNNDLTSEVKFALPAEGVTVGTVEIIAQRPLIKKDATNTLVSKTSEEITSLAVRGVTNVAGLQASVVKDEASNILYVRGGRPEEVSYLIDGVPVNNPLSGQASASFSNVNQNSVEELQLQTGGYNAEYGSAMSGILNVTTKTGASNYSITGEYITDAFMSQKVGQSNHSYGFYDANLSVSGPIIPGGSVGTFFLSGERLIAHDNDPRAVWGYKPNTSTEGWTFTGKIGLTLIKAVDIKLGGTGYMRTGNSWDNFRRFVDAEHQQKFDNDTWSGYLRLTQNIGSNIFYTLQGSYFNEKLMSGDGVWFDDLLSYGDKAKNPALTSTAVNPAAIFSTIAAPGNVLDRFTKSKSEIITINADVNAQVGRHLLKAGGEYRDYKIRRYTVNPMGLSLPLTGASTGWSGYRTNNVEYYGYDYTGTVEKNTDDYFGSKLEGPKKPIYIAGYIQDKVELEDLVLNLGIRVDHFDAKEQVFKDPKNPFGARGTPGGGTFDAGDLQSSEAFTTYSPRLGFSFPVTDRAVFHAQYGTFLQMPPLQNVLISKTWADRMVGDSPFSTRIPNANLKPERTISYEVGYKQLLTDNVSLAITGFYKEIKDLIQARNAGTAESPSYPNGYETFENVDFGTVKGFDFIFELRRTKNLSMVLNYTISYASGTGSDPNTQSRISWIQTESPKVISALDFDRRHNGSLNIDYRTGSGEGMMVGDSHPFANSGASLLFVFNSGVPYTQSVVTNPFFGGVTEVRPTGGINEAYTPWNFRFDLRLDKGFGVGPVNFIASLSVINVLGTKNVFGVYRGTGDANNSGWLSTKAGQDWAATTAPQVVNGQTLDPVTVFKNREEDPTNYGIPRQIRLGLRMEY